MKKFNFTKINGYLIIIFALIIATAIIVSSFSMGANVFDLKSEGVSVVGENSSTIYGGDIPDYNGEISEEVLQQYESAKAAGVWQETPDIQYSPAVEAINQNRDGTFNNPYYIVSADQLVKTINNAQPGVSYNNANTYFVIKNDIDLGAKIYSVSNHSQVYFNITGYDYTALPGFEDFATANGFNGQSEYSDIENPFNAIIKYLDDNGIGESVSDIQESNNDFATIKNLYLEPEATNAEIGLFETLSGRILAINIYNSYAIGDYGFFNFGFVVGVVKQDAWLGKISVKGGTFVYNANRTVGGVGGIIGQIQTSETKTIMNSVSFEGGIIGRKNSSTGFTGLANVGGLVGYLNKGDLLLTGKNEAYGNITAMSGVGGFIGRVLGNAVIESENTNYLSVNGNSGTGGFIGSVSAPTNSEAYVEIRGNSQNLATVSGNKEGTGGYIGYKDSYSVVKIENGVNGYAGGDENYNDPNAYIQTSASVAGGFIGSSSGNIELINCHNYMTVSSSSSSNNNRIAGIAGVIIGGTFKNCVNHADINPNLSSNSNVVGGIVGEANGTSSFSDCINYGAVCAFSESGGILGRTGGGGVVVSIQNCKNYGILRGYYNIGGILGSVAASASTITVVSCSNFASIYACDTIFLSGKEKEDSTGYYTDEEAYDLTVNKANLISAGGIIGYYKPLNASITINDCVNGSEGTESVIKANGRYVGGILGGHSAGYDEVTVLNLARNKNYMEIYANGFMGGLYGMITGYVNLTIGNPSFDEGYVKNYGNFATVYSRLENSPLASSDCGSLIGKITGFLKLVGDNDYENDTEVNSINQTVGGMIGYLLMSGTEDLEFNAVWGNTATVYGGGAYIGGIIGGVRGSPATISATMYNKGDVICRYGNEKIGGIIGDCIVSLTIKAQVYNEGNVYSQLKTGDSSYSSTRGYIGGIIGRATEGLEFVEGSEGSYNSGIIFANFGQVGGIVGSLSKSGYFKGVYSYENSLIASGGTLEIDIYDTNGNSESLSIEATIQGEYRVSGFVGHTYSNLEEIYFYDCVNYASCLGIGNDVGGFLGFPEYTGVSLYMDNCFNYGDIETRASYVGGLAGSELAGVYVSNSGNYGDIKSTTGIAVGGLFAQIGRHVNHKYNSTLTNCFNEGLVSGSQSSGGLAGKVHCVTDLTIENCYNKGNVVFEGIASGGGGSARYVGGLLGLITQIYGTINIDGCYVECDKIATLQTFRTGGLIGGIEFNAASSLNITKCYTDIGSIYASRDVGACIGYLFSDSRERITNFTLTDCYFLGDKIEGLELAAGIMGYCDRVKNIRIERVAVLVDEIVSNSNNYSVSAITQNISAMGSVTIKNVYITSDIVTISGYASLIMRQLNFNLSSGDISFVLENYYFSGDVQASAVNTISIFTNTVTSTSYTKSFSVHNVYFKDLPQTATFNLVGGDYETPSTSLPQFSPQITNKFDFEFGEGKDNRFVAYSELQNIDNFEDWGITEDTRSGNADTSVTPWGIDGRVNDGKPFLIEAQKKSLTVYYNNSGDDLDIFDNETIRGVNEIGTETVLNIITYVTDTLSYNDIVLGARSDDGYEYLKTISRIGYTVSDLYKQREEDGSFLAKNLYSDLSLSDPYKTVSVKNDMTVFVKYNLQEYTISLDGEETEIFGSENNKFTIKSTGIYVKNIVGQETSSPFVYFALKVPSSSPAEYNAIGEDKTVLVEGEAGLLNAVYRLNFEDFLNQQIIYNYVFGSTLTLKAMFVKVYKVSFSLADGTFPSYFTVTDSNGVSVSYNSPISIEENKSVSYKISITKHYRFVSLKEGGNLAVSGNGYVFDEDNLTITIENCVAGEEYDFEISVSAIVYTVNYTLNNSFGESISPSAEDISIAKNSQSVTIGSTISGQSISINPNSIYKFCNYRYKYLVNGSVVYENIDTQGSEILGSIVCTGEYLDKYVNPDDYTITIQILFESDISVLITISNFAEWLEEYGYVDIYVYNSSYSFQYSEMLTRDNESFSDSFDVGCIIEVVPYANKHFEITALTLNNGSASLTDGKITLILENNQTLEIEMDYIKYNISYSVVDENNNEIDGGSENISVTLGSGNDYITTRGDNVTATISEIFGYGFNAWGIYYMGEFFEFDSSEFSIDGTLNNALISVEDLDNYLDEYNQITIACRLYTLFNINFAISDASDNLGDFEVQIFNDTYNRYEVADINEIQSLPYNSLIKIIAKEGEYYGFIGFSGVFAEEISSEDDNVAEFRIAESRNILLNFEAKEITSTFNEDLSNASGQLVITNSSGSTDTWKAGDTLTFTFEGAFGQQIKSFSFNGIDAKELASSNDNVTYANGVLTIMLTLEFLESLQNNEFTVAVSSQIATVYLVMLLSIIIIPIVVTVLILVFVIINVNRRKKAMEIIMQRKNAKSRFEASNMISDLKSGNYRQADRSVSKEEIERQLKLRNKKD